LALCQFGEATHQEGVVSIIDVELELRLADDAPSLIDNTVVRVKADTSFWVV
jgi:hypothetical protein